MLGYIDGWTKVTTEGDLAAASADAIFNSIVGHLTN